MRACPGQKLIWRYIAVRASFQNHAPRAALPLRNTRMCRSARALRDTFTEKWTVIG